MEEEEENIPFPPNLLSPMKMLEDLNAASVINLTNFTLGFILGRAVGWGEWHQLKS